MITKLKAQWKGFSLIEIFIALNVFITLVLSLSALQIHIWRETLAASFYARAHRQVLSISYFILQNNQILDMSDILAQWQQVNARLLPNGRGRVLEDAHCIILSIAWGKDTSHPCINNQLGGRRCIQLILKK
jgi:hypothetical protein